MAQDNPPPPGANPPPGAIQPGSVPGVKIPGQAPATGQGSQVDSVSLSGTGTAVPAKKPAPAPAKPMPLEHNDSFREFIETIVFVVVLVLMLKTFLAEAFVIPTGSMATTLYGYHKSVRCTQCQFDFPVNCSKEAEAPPDRPAAVINAALCPNCQWVNEIPLGRK